jgi:hypothetical protein
MPTETVVVLLVIQTLSAGAVDSSVVEALQRGQGAPAPPQVQAHARATLTERWHTKRGSNVGAGRRRPNGPRWSRREGCISTSCTPDARIWP